MSTNLSKTNLIILVKKDIKYYEAVVTRCESYTTDRTIASIGDLAEKDILDDTRATKIRSPRCEGGAVKWRSNHLRRKKALCLLWLDAPPPPRFPLLIPHSNLSGSGT